MLQQSENPHFAWNGSLAALSTLKVLSAFKVLSGSKMELSGETTRCGDFGNSLDWPHLLLPEKMEVFQYLNFPKFQCKILDYAIW